MHSRARLFLLPVVLVGMIGFGGCAAGYRRRPLVDRQILQDLQNIKFEALQPSAVPEKVKPLASGASFDPAKGITVDEAVLVAEYLNPGIRASGHPGVSPTTRGCRRRTGSAGQFEIRERKDRS